MVPCLLVLGINIAHSLMHSAMAMVTVFMLRRGLSKGKALWSACLLCMCVRGVMCALMVPSVIFIFAHKYAVLLNAQNRIEKLLFCVSSFVRFFSQSRHHYASHHFSLAANLAHMPVSHNCGLFRHYFFFFFTFSNPPSSFFSLSCPQTLML